MRDKDRLHRIAEELREGRPGPQVTVREFLDWFYAQRRGSWIVLYIRQQLAEAGLKTEPDFQSAYIDSFIGIALATQPQEEGEAREPLAEPLDGTAVANAPTLYADPTFRLSKLAAANKTLVSVKPNSEPQEAVTPMLMHDFSQLPVMTTEREVKGVVSWASIGARRALGEQPATAGDAMEAHQELRADSSLFQAIPVIVEHQYVLVRSPQDNRISGIVTASDLSLQFRQLAEPFL